jgi:hypothetical protein
VIVVGGRSYVKSRLATGYSLLRLEVRDSTAKVIDASPTGIEEVAIEMMASRTAKTAVQTIERIKSSRRI